MGYWRLAMSGRDGQVGRRVFPFIWRNAAGAATGQPPNTARASSELGKAASAPTAMATP
jgi:hypothetical protein